MRASCSRRYSASNANSRSYDHEENQKTQTPAEAAEVLMDAIEQLEKVARAMLRELNGTPAVLRANIEIIETATPDFFALDTLRAELAAWETEIGAVN